MRRARRPWMQGATTKAMLLRSDDADEGPIGPAPCAGLRSGSRPAGARWAGGPVFRLLCEGFVWPASRRGRIYGHEYLGFEARADGDFRFEKLGNRAAGFGGLDGGVELGFIRSGNAGQELEMALGDAEAVADF